jgi:glutamine synthetase
MRWHTYGAGDVYVFENPNYRCPYPWWSKDAIAVMCGGYWASEYREYQKHRHLIQHTHLKYFTRKTANMHRHEKFCSIIRIIGRTQLFKQELFRTHCYIEV